MSKQLLTEIILNLSGNLSDKARQYGAQMSKLGQRSQVAFNMVAKSSAAASRGIDTFGNRAIIGAGAVAIAFERTFVKTAAEFERYQVMLNKLQGSEEGGAKAMEWIEKFTQETPYGVNEVMNSFIRLKAFGLDPMDGSLQAIADQAAMMGGTAETVDGIALALGQAWTKGKLQGEEALQLLERGVPVWDYLIKASKELGQNNGIGYTAAQLQDMASKGLLTRDAIKSLINEMAKASEGSAKKQMATWNGMISNMGDSWTVFKKDVMDSGAFEVLKEELGGFLAQLDEMKKTGEYDELVEKVGKNLVEAFEKAADAARGIREVGKDLLPVLRAVGSGAAAISEAVGGYENLAKILLSVYMLNKALRVGAPLLKGALSAGGFVLDKATGGKSKAGNAMAQLGAMPVYVVNMPAGGFGGDVLPDGSKTPPSKKGGKWWSRLAITANSAVDLATPYVATAARVAAPVAAITALASTKEYDPANPTFKPLDFGPTGKEKSQTQATKDLMEKFNQAYKRPQSAFELASQGPSGNVNLKIEVSDDRIKVTPTYAAPGITIDPDTGAN